MADKKEKKHFEVGVCGAYISKFTLYDTHTPTHSEHICISFHSIDVYNTPYTTYDVQTSFDFLFRSFNLLVFRLCAAT